MTMTRRAPGLRGLSARAAFAALVVTGALLGAFVGVPIAVAQETAASAKETTAPPKEKAAPPKETTAPPKDKAAPPKETTAPPKEKAAPPKETTAPPKETVPPKAEGPPAPGKIPPALAERLNPAQQKAYLAFREARAAFDNALRAYWRKVESKRSVRRAKRRQDQAITADDYIATYPPKYKGPELPADIAKIVAELRPPRPEHPEQPEREELPTVADFINHAKAQFGFVPKRATEREFKTSYAREALAVGLSKDQVVRVYALETGGLGTYDMLSGLHPITKQGKPISSALGYAQLLHANSTGELVKHGDAFIKRLTDMAAAPGTSPERASELKTKVVILKKMLRAARSVPNEWSHHQRFAMTPAGLGIHALNLDADIGPWLQVLKLKGLKDIASRHGYANLTGAQIELMNLAGPGTGLEMMTPLGKKMPTPNYFSEGGYSRNPVVRDKNAAELLDTLQARMEANIKKAGSVEFGQVFDEVGRMMAKK